MVIGVYSENGKLKKKIEEMTRLVHEQNAKIYAHRAREGQLQRDNEELKAQLVRAQD